MKRRRLIAIISLCTLAGLAVLAVAAGMVVMKTDFARSRIEALLASKIRGKVTLGRISGNPLRGITVDTFAVRDTTGELVISTGKVSVEYDIRDIADTRLLFRRVDAQHPLIHLRQHADYTWNYQFWKSGPSLPKPKVPSRSFGDYFVLDSVTASNVTFILSLPVHYDSSLSRARRDSAIRFDLKRKDRRIEKTADGYARSYIWTGGSGLVSHIRLTDPDSNRFGHEFRIARLNVNEFDPPFRFRNLAGVVRQLGDSLWLNIRHFDLPASTGSGIGKIVWGSNLPIRYDIVVRGDSIALADINWVYPTLPKTGGGSAVIRIANKRDMGIMDYHIDSMDVRSTRSRLVGEMTFGVGSGILQVRNVNLKAQPIDFDLVRALAGAPFPVDWQGQIFGDIRAPGGPLDQFRVDAASGEWRDTHVPGAVSRLSGRGGLDILKPAFTAFHNFDVNVGSLDLRSIEYLFPAFPKLKGTIAGRATLDSVWTDVRFRNADITHRDGPGTPSHVTGSGRVTDGTPFITYDLRLFADPLSFDMLSRSFPGLTLTGTGTGPIAISGQSPDLKIEADLVSAGGGLKFAGNIDIDSLGGYGARGVGEIRNVDLSRLLTKKGAARTSLTGRFDVDVRGSSARTLSGNARLTLDSGRYNRIPFNSVRGATVRFDQGKAILTDSLLISSPLGGLIAEPGAIGLADRLNDSIQVTLSLDSIGAFRALMDNAAKDSLTGHVTVTGNARGSLDSLTMSGQIHAKGLYLKGFDALAMDGTFSILDALSSPHGSVNALFQNVLVGGMRFDTLSAGLNLADTTHFGVALDGVGFGADTTRLHAAAQYAAVAGRTTIRLDDFRIGFANALWSLDHAATLTMDSSMFTIDALGLRDQKKGSVTLSGTVPNNGPVSMRLASSGVPLIDLARITGLTEAKLGGWTNLRADITGTKDNPIIDVTTTLDSIGISTVSIGNLRGAAHYANRSASINADIFQGAKRVFHGQADSLPLAIRFFGYDTLPGQLRVRATADSADFTLIEAPLSEFVHSVTGKLSGQMTMNGSWAKPNLMASALLLNGGMRIDTLGLALQNMFGNVTYADDTLRVNSLSASSGGDRNSATLKGTVAFDRFAVSRFDLAMEMRDFLAYNRGELATIYARTDSGPVKLFGRFGADTLTGVVQVERGAIYLPDPKLAGKRFTQAASFNTDSIVNGRIQRARDTSLYERATRNLETDLLAHIGGNFQLSADYATIPLSGDLRIVPVATTDIRSRSSTDFISKLAPFGTINADRGTYSIELLGIKKDFDVQSGGTITFDRDAEWNGLMDVSARYLVRSPGNPDIPIIVTVKGRLLAPAVDIRADAAFPISKSDALSYLIFGQPGFTLFGGNLWTQSQQGGGLISALLSPIASSAANDFLKRSGLGLFDQIRLQNAGLQQNNGGQAALQFLTATRVTGDLKSFWNQRLVVNVSSGFCSLTQNFLRNESGNPFGGAFLGQSGLAVTYRFPSTLNTGSTIQASTEPSTKLLLCSPSAGLSTQGVVPTPRQWGLAFLKFWRW